ncbi:DUF3833 domain-containing protein [Citreimonas salinaria]|uniref:DUF3833 domain-containing protein n=1 Tax=Citreimonas salinaria TaxID=321339 RepID=A0A1H3L6L1_9RHOB|nr:DUF3833 domain-containing protein [Citreimonas salinaria]SDY59574.1 Protein of unknown function [Citreimonas salinaria]
MEALYFVAGSAAMLGMSWLRARWFGFVAQKPADYRGAPGEALDLRRHLNGPILCDGVIYGPTGRVSSRFTAEFDAAWEGNRGRLIEHFVYDTGARQRREWTLMLGNDGRVTATAPDVVGEGLGRVEGPALQLRYRIRLPADAGGHVLDATDWMYLGPNGTIVNRSQFRKFGIKVAELVATMRRKEAA